MRMQAGYAGRRTELKQQSSRSSHRAAASSNKQQQHRHHSSRRDKRSSFVSVMSCRLELRGGVSGFGADGNDEEEEDKRQRGRDIEAERQRDKREEERQEGRDGKRGKHRSSSFAITRQATKCNKMPTRQTGRTMRTSRRDPQRPALRYIDAWIRSCVRCVDASMRMYVCMYVYMYVCTYIDAMLPPRCCSISIPESHPAPLAPSCR